MKKIFSYCFKWIVACFSPIRYSQSQTLNFENNGIVPFLKMVSDNKTIITEKNKYEDKFFFWKKNISISNKITYTITRIPSLFIGFFSYIKYFNQITWLYPSVNWHKDASSGYRWSRYIYYPLVRLFSKKKGVEVKYPWEISRMQHLVEIAFIEDTNKAKDIYLNHLSDFMFSNPYKLGINWVCTMDISIRAINFLVSFYILLYRKCTFSSSQQKIINSTLWMHAEYIFNNLEKSDKSLEGNHYYSNISALLILSSHFNLNSKSKTWLEYSFNEFWRLTDTIFNNDGTSYECSTAYHRLVSEMFFYTFLFTKDMPLKHQEFLSSRKNSLITNQFIKEGLINRKEVNNFLQKNYCFLYAISKPNGFFYQIGDNDSGRFLNFDFLYKDDFTREYSNINIQRSVYTLKKHLSIFFDLTQNIEFKIKAKEAETYCFNNLNMIEKESYNSIYDLSSLEKFYFSDFGVFILKNNTNFIGFRCGGLTGKLTHAHEDQLSTELTLDNNDIFVDKGSYTYTQYPDIRNKLRSQLYHNCPMIDDKIKQADISRGIFSFKSLIEKQNLHFYTSNNSFHIVGEIFISENLLIREIIIQKNNVQIKDYSGQNKKYISINRVKTQFHSPEYGIINN